MRIRATRIRLSIRNLAVVGGLAFLLAAASCAVRTERTEQADESAANEPNQQVDEAAETRHRGHHHRASLRVVFEAVLEHGDLTAEQEETVQAIRADLHIGREAKRQMGKQMRTAAVEIVRSGTADSEQFDLTIDQATAVIEERMNAHADALNELHLILDDDQRAAVAAVLRERIEERWGKRHGGNHKKRFKKLVTHLMLSHFQITKLKALRVQLLGESKSLRPSREELVALVDAFEGEDFDEALAELQTEKMGLVRERLSRAGEVTDTVLSLLSSGQRGLLAELIEHGPRAVGIDQKH